MGTLPIESRKIKLNNGEKGNMQFFTTTDDMGRQKTDGAYYCIIDINNVIYSRDFLIKKYSDYHFENFLKKFTRNADYRQKWLVEE
ncbi:MAG: hypothetical protein ACOCQR_03025 [bacterium]